VVRELDGEAVDASISQGRVCWLPAIDSPPPCVVPGCDRSSDAIFALARLCFRPRSVADRPVRRHRRRLQACY
jgi:hypothetical protein